VLHRGAASLCCIAVLHRYTLAPFPFLSFPFFIVFLLFAPRRGGMQGKREELKS
jgi:hypothetical protein